MRSVKFDEHRLNDLIPRIAAFRAVLVHGADPVLVDERCRLILQAVHHDDGWGVVDLDASEHARLPAAIESPMLGGQPPIVRLRGATDTAVSSIERVLEGAGSGLVIVSAGPLLARSRLRSLCERHAKVASVSCRDLSPRDARARLDGILAEFGLGMALEARSLFLQSDFGSGNMTHDAEKLALHAAGAPEVGVADVMALDHAKEGGGLDELALATSTRDASAADRVLAGLFAEAVPVSTILRGLLGHFTRVRACRALLDGGSSLDEALESLRPPVFSSRAAMFRQAVMAWTILDLERACHALWDADMRCRTGAASATSLCLGAVARLTRRSG